MPVLKFGGILDDMISVKKSWRKLSSGRVVPVEAHVRESPGVRSFAGIDSHSAALKTLLQDDPTDRGGTKGFARLLARHPFIRKGPLSKGVSTLNPKATRIAAEGFYKDGGAWHVASCLKRKRFRQKVVPIPDQHMFPADCCESSGKDMNAAREALVADRTIGWLNQVIPFSPYNEVPEGLRDGLKDLPPDAVSVLQSEIRKSLNENIEAYDDIRNRMAAVVYLSGLGPTGRKLAETVSGEETPTEALKKAVRELAKSNPTRDMRDIETECNTLYYDMLESIEVPSDIENAWKTPVLVECETKLETMSDNLTEILKLLDQVKLTLDYDELERIEELEDDVRGREGRGWREDVTEYLPPLSMSDVSTMESEIKEQESAITYLKGVLETGETEHWKTVNAVYSTYGTDVEETMKKQLQHSYRNIRTGIIGNVNVDSNSGFIIAALLS